MLIGIFEGDWSKELGKLAEPTSQCWMLETTRTKPQHHVTNVTCWILSCCSEDCLQSVTSFEHAQKQFANTNWLDWLSTLEAVPVL